MTILVNIMKYHTFMYIFSIDTINLRNKTLVFAHLAAGVTHTSLLMTVTVWRFPHVSGSSLAGRRLRFAATEAVNQSSYLGVLL